MIKDRINICKVSVVIPTWNRREYLRKCLISVFKQDYSNLEVVVIDNNSSDDTVAMIKGEFKHITLIINGRNMGACVARNQGLVNSCGEYIWFLDSDCEVIDHKCLSNMVKIMRENSAIGSIGGEFNLIDNENMLLKRKFILRNGATQTLPINDNNPLLLECDFLATCNCLVRRELLLKSGGFDPAYFILGEDRELGYLISKMGSKNIIDIRTSALHNVTLKGREGDLFRSHKNRIRFAVKNFKIADVLFLPLHDIVYLISSNNFKLLRKKDINVLKHLSPHLRSMFYSREGKGVYILELLIVGVIYIISLCAAYSWNILFIFSTLKIRFKKTNFLKHIPKPVLTERIVLD